MADSTEKTIGTEPVVKEKKEKIDVMALFLQGAKKGWDMGIGNMMPAMVLAFSMIVFINKIGLMDLLGIVFGPLMGIFGVPVCPPPPAAA